MKSTYPYFYVQGRRINDESEAIRRATELAIEDDKPVDVFIRRSRFATNAQVAFLTIVPALVERGGILC